MIESLQREGIYLWYYFSLQFSQIFRYWVLGMVLGSAVPDVPSGLPLCGAAPRVTLRVTGRG